MFRLWTSDLFILAKIRCSRLLAYSPRGTQDHICHRWKSLLTTLARATASERPDGREDTAGLDCFRKMMSFISFYANCLWTGTLNSSGDSDKRRSLYLYYSPIIFMQSRCSQVTLFFYFFRFFHGGALGMYLGLCPRYCLKSWSGFRSISFDLKFVMMEMKDKDEGPSENDGRRKRIRLVRVACEGHFEERGTHSFLPLASTSFSAILLLKSFLKQGGRDAYSDRVEEKNQSAHI